VRSDLLDLNMPGMDGFEGSTAPAACRAGYADRGAVGIGRSVGRQQALAHGAAGYIPKTTAGTTLVNALQIILAGEIYCRRPDVGTGVAPDRARPAPCRSPIGRWMLKALAEGLTNKEIARRLGIAEITVRCTSSIYQLGVSNRTEALAAAQSRTGHASKVVRHGAPAQASSNSRIFCDSSLRRYGFGSTWVRLPSVACRAITLSE
jgi:DNA-binding NarL/FixJ family response regulator